MSENQTINIDQMLSVLPGGFLRIALDDELTIIYATDTFYNLIEMDNSKQAKPPKSIFKTVYSADIIYYTQQIAAGKQKKDNQFLLFYRVLQKNGELKWIMINGSKTDEVYQKQNKTYPIYFCIALDVSEHMIDYRKLEQELDYHLTILELSKELFFEYVIATDTLTFSELFREVFGKESVMKDFSKKLEKTKLIHADDLPGVIRIYKSMMSGKKQARIEFRMTTKDGDIAWYVCYASIIFDDNKNPFKVVGKLSIICSKQGDKKASPEVNFDSLTRLYTKDSAEDMIVDSMLNQDSEAISALFLCEVRNYKGLNEVVRIVDGENVLVSIAGVLKRLFRRTDVIGRMGLGDFVVYMKDIRSERNAYEKAEYICREVNNLYSYDYNKNGVIISIGVVLIKGQTDYSLAFSNAKSALVMAKKDSSNSSFEIFYPSLNK
ncbi:MAG: diguanylate cyclase [Anaerolineaceae bacterium]|nr:MAG: diguanylate cyclase [Anaerolineaceae bacterium]